MKKAFEIFLSHSHADIRAARILADRWGPAGFGHAVYADFMDEALIAASRKGTMDVALSAHLRAMILRCRIFVFVASASSAGSGWMPWELGMAHGAIGRVHVYRLGSGWDRASERREYLRLYESTSFGPGNARDYLAAVIARAKSEPTDPSQEEAAIRQGERIARALERGDILDVLRQAQRSPLVQGALTAQGFGQESGTSLPVSTTTQPRRRWRP